MGHENEPSVSDDAQSNEQSTELEAVVRAVVVRHVCASPVRVSTHDGGLSSHTYVVETKRDRLIVQVGDAPDKLANFERARRAVERARAAGVPTQNVLAVGREGAWAYSIACQLPGTMADSHPQRLRVLEALARLAATIHTIGTVGCGRDYKWGGESPVGVRSWAAFLRDELGADRRIQHLRDHDLISERQRQALTATLAEVEKWDGSPVLQHGDLRLKNVLADAEGRIVGLVDWKTSISSIGPHWDVSVALHDLAIDAKQAFLQSYGMAETEIRRAAPVWRLFNIINYVPDVDQLILDCDGPALERMRTRLTGALDLYGAGLGS